MSGFLVSAPWRSSGKTIVTAGLAAAARRHNLRVQTFKKGPDYIDPMWLGQASGGSCYNLDLYMQSEAELQATYHRYTQQADVAFIEGTMGLHDGLAGDGSDSNAAVSRLLNTPVVLVADCRGMHRTVAALVKGVQEFDPQVRFAGLILNRIRSSRHLRKIRTALESYTDIDLLGALPERDELTIDERELGLLPATQTQAPGGLIDTAASLLVSECDLDNLFNQVQPTCGVALSDQDSQRIHSAQGLTIGLARDEAFNFYYADDLEQLRLRGARVVEISPLRDSFPEHLDGLLIGGGFPERYAAQLAANTAFRSKLKLAIEAGLCVRAECGGLMYLCRSLQVENCSYPMIGAIAADVHMCRRPQGRGYVQLQRPGTETVLQGHEFHHSRIDFDNSADFEYRVLRGFGVDGKHDGVRVYNVLASYAHLRHTKATPWLDWFVGQIHEMKKLEGSAKHV